MTHNAHNEKDTIIRYAHVEDELFSKNGINATRGAQLVANELQRRTKGFSRFELEIGSGNGKFLVEHAEERADVFFIGVERSRKAINKSLSKAAKRDLPNLVFIWGDAMDTMERALNGAYAFGAVYVNFPDPWPKKKHTKRRIFGEAFITLIHALMLPDAVLYAVTDFKSYATDVISPLLEGSALYENTLPSLWTHNLEGYKQTLYETKMRARGESIYYMRYKKARQE